MQIQRFNSTIWPPSSGAKYDIQPRDGYNYQQHNDRLTQWNNTLLNLPLLESYARAIDSKGSPLPSCFSFIDSVNSKANLSTRKKKQRIAYNGHKRVHGLKYQSVVLPNGMTANKYGPVEIKREDRELLERAEERENNEEKPPDEVVKQDDFFEDEFDRDLGLRQEHRQWSGACKNHTDYQKITKVLVILLKSELNSGNRYEMFRDVENKTGKTFLHYAAELGFLRVTKTLVKKCPGLLALKTKPQLKPKKRRGLLPVELALIAENDEVAAYMIRMMWHESLHAALYVIFLLFLSYALLYGSTKLDPTQYRGAADSLQGFCEVVTLLMVVFYICEEINQMRKERHSYFKDWMNLFDWLGLALMLCLIPLRYTDNKAQWRVPSLAFQFNFLRIFKFSCVTRTTGLYTKTLAMIIQEDVTRFMAVFAVVSLSFCGALFLSLQSSKHNQQFRPRKSARLEYDVDRISLLTRMEGLPFLNLRVKYYKEGDWIREMKLAKDRHHWESVEEKLDAIRDMMREMVKQMRPDIE
ncbi:hypothetical protein AWC38_SpisGene23114 [Stylophora pistillata]|uniref:Ion transport domain-containing protein n=1 Tax=Stylophora pistillata TaxID=50429 RepID=A0A2B4R7Q6_STYPI|nr:hypothetical protein AWC38_SpisGene23114 [Stylophora pistillata]